MIDVEAYRGIGQFGPAYRVMSENDAHAPGSVDRVLVERMVRLCPETVAWLYGGFTPRRLKYSPGLRPEMERHLRQIGAETGDPERRLERICAFCANLARSTGHGLDALRFGGTEEDLIRRGTDFCNELARIACVLSQIAALPARIIMLADTMRAYSGHAIVEVFRSGVWGAADTTTNVVYRHGDGRPATTWELMNDSPLVESHRRGMETIYTDPGTFRAGAVANYFAWEQGEYDYAVSGVNDYYRSILEMSNRGWPGGLRWLHGEDGA